MGSPRERDRSRHKSSRDRDRSRSKDRRHKEERRKDDKDRRRRSRSRSRTRSRDRHRKRDRSSERDASSKRRRDESVPSATQLAASAAANGSQLSPLEAARQQALVGHDAEEQRRREREAEQAKLDAEMEKRRKRIQAWQEQRRKEEEAAAAAAEQPPGEEGGGTAKKQKAWTLEDESSDDDEEQLEPEGGDAAMPDAQPPPVAQEDDEVDPLDAFMQQNVAPAVQQQEAAAAPAQAQEEDEDIDPLDAFMQSNVLPAVQQQGAPAEAAGAAVQQKQPEAGAPATAHNGEATSKPKRRPRKSRYDTDSSGEEPDSSADEAEEESEDEAEWMRKLIAGKLSKGDKLAAVDHASVSYPPFRRNFYIEVPELARMTPEEVEEYRRQLDGVKVRGKDVPKPVKNWHQCGLSSRILEVLRKNGFERPLPIQAQALPIIMSGRDCIGIAKTGSGKTLAFVLPMLRHVKDQPPLQDGDGPIGLVMAPTRELVNQISKEVKRFAKAVGVSCVTVYGGSGVANQITELKRGTEAVVCTPGRLIDLLVTGAGRITNLRRVTYLVLDEADRMFDMGFEPQIMRVVQNIRPDRQTVMFSATFPRQVEVLARQVLNNPVEIQVGGRSVVNKDITQYVEIRPEEDRFLRLLEILGEWYERGKLLIFVSSQDRCDTLFRDLLRAGYPCLSLHGGKDQSDRESTIADFKANVCNILVATSVAARGLDVRDLVLVLNYDVPNHHEDYVHRVGRTGRAGAKGTAITFIAPDEPQYAPDLLKALKESGQPIPKDLQAMAEAFEQQRKEGKAQQHGSGFGGRGFRFDASEDNAVKEYKKSLVKQARKAAGEEESESEVDDDEIREVVGGQSAALPGAADAQAQAGAALSANPLQQIGISEEQLAAMPPEVQARVKAAQALAAKLSAQGPPQQPAPAAPGTMPAAGAVPGAMGLPFPGIIPASAYAQQQPQPMIIPASAYAQAQAGAHVGAVQAPTALNPILAAAQAAALRLGQQAGVQQPAQPEVAALQQPGIAQQPAAPAAAGGVPVLPASLAAMMLGPGGQLPMAAPAAPGGMPGAPAGAVPGAVPGALPGAVPGAPAQAPAERHFETELEINDFPQHARWKVTHRETIRDIGELGAAVVVKGKYYKLGTAPGPLDERKLYLHIEGPTPDVVKRAKQEVKRILEEATEKAMRHEGPAPGRYSVM